MPLKLTLPPDLDRRLDGLSDVIAAASADVTFAYLFGSAATGARRPGSDVDVAVCVAPGADAHAARLAVARACARHLGTDAVDVVLLNAAPISLAGRVLTTRRVLLDRDPFARHQYESLHLRMFHDFRIREHRLLASVTVVVDRDLILRRLELLDTYLEQLAPYRDLDVAAYEQDWRTQRTSSGRFTWRSRPA